jgi:hypothetical protein
MAKEGGSPSERAWKHFNDPSKWLDEDGCHVWTFDRIKVHIEPNGPQYTVLVRWVGEKWGSKTLPAESWAKQYAWNCVVKILGRAEP